MKKNNTCEIAVVKVGSNALITPKGVNEKTIAKITDGIAYMMSQNLKVVLITSGAVAVGRTLLTNYDRDSIEYQEKLKNMGEIKAKQFLASLGQRKLMDIYQKHFDHHNILCGQLLLTTRDIMSNDSAKEIKDTIHDSFSMDSIPIINANDSVSIEELTSSDNDKLSGNVAKLLLAKYLILLTDVRGVYRDKNDSTTLISTNLSIKDIDQLLLGDLQSSSSNGTGGMHSKISTGKEAAQNGIKTIITNADQADENLIKISQGQIVGTNIIP